MSSRPAATTIRVVNPCDDSIADEVIDDLAAATDALVLGDPLHEATDVSALINPGERDRVVSWVAGAVAAGARVAAGGTIECGHPRPTVLIDVTPVMDIGRPEVFDPVVAIQ
jgi:acyl-CoA reductase-like NAD-dependent aldehyde dehydrogenase